MPHLWIATSKSGSESTSNGRAGVPSPSLPASPASSPASASARIPTTPFTWRSCSCSPSSPCGSFPTAGSVEIDPSSSPNPFAQTDPGLRFAPNRRLRRPGDTALTHPCGKVLCSRCRQPGPVSLTLDSHPSPVAAAPGSCGLGLPVRCPSTSKTSPAPGTDGDPTSASR